MKPDHLNSEQRVFLFCVGCFTLVLLAVIGWGIAWMVLNTPVHHG